MPPNVTPTGYADRLLDGRRWSQESRVELRAIVAGTATDFPADWQQRINAAWGQAQAGAGIKTQIATFEQPANERRILGAVRRALNSVAVSWAAQGSSSEPASPSAPASTSQEQLAALLAAQGVQPIHDIAELVFPDWPEDESADDVIAAVRAWRDEREPPSRP